VLSPYLLGEQLAEGLPALDAMHYGANACLGLANATHAVMKPTRPETPLCDLKAPALT